MYHIRQDDLSSEQTKALLMLHLAGMHAASPPGTVLALDYSGLQTPEVTVWSAWRDDRIAGIGALKMLGDHTGEIKSMRTHPDFLRQGVGAALLATIVEVAQKREVRRLSLETGRGEHFEAALELYRHHGFINGPSFADYGDNGFSQFLHLDLPSLDAHSGPACTESGRT